MQQLLEPLPLSLFQLTLQQAEEASKGFSQLAIQLLEVADIVEKQVNTYKSTLERGAIRQLEILQGDTTRLIMAYQFASRYIARPLEQIQSQLPNPTNTVASEQGHIQQRRPQIQPNNNINEDTLDRNTIYDLLVQLTKKPETQVKKPSRPPPRQPNPIQKQSKIKKVKKPKQKKLVRERTITYGKLDKFTFDLLDYNITEPDLGKVCVFCKKGTEPELGPLYEIHSDYRPIYAHDVCALWTNKMYLKPNENRFVVSSLMTALSEGFQKNCLLCGNTGATIYCQKHFKGECENAYHFPCFMQRYNHGVVKKDWQILCGVHDGFSTMPKMEVINGNPIETVDDT